ncbi:MAG: glycerol-3-phosphate 1-O-acyltransferase PlsY [Clostridia bacterium]|nr:glycerol-3-phosphate 1-O-acyltransferase PlsY [Clostridia bacterium]
MVVLVVLVVSYLLGSISFGYLVAKYWKGIDIRQFGSGNIGTTNVFRTLGPTAGVMVFLGDFLKGAAGAWLGLWAGTEWIGVLAGFAAMAGHSYPVFLNFKGGKVIATGVGVLFALDYTVALLALVIFALILFLYRYVSLASIIAAGSVPVLLIAFREPIPYIVFGLIGASFAIYKHKANIQRLRTGTEPRIGRK